MYIHLCAYTLKEVMEWNDSVKSCTDLTLPLHGSWKAPVMYQESAEALIRTGVNHCSGNPEETEAAWGEVSRASGRRLHRRLRGNGEVFCASHCCTECWKDSIFHAIFCVPGCGKVWFRTSMSYPDWWNHVLWFPPVKPERECSAMILRPFSHAHFGHARETSETQP